MQRSTNNWSCYIWLQLSHCITVRFNDWQQDPYFNAPTGRHSRVCQVDAEVECGANNEVELVPPAAVPVQAGPGDDALSRPGLVPSAVVVNVLPLLQDQHREEMRSLGDIQHPRWSVVQGWNLLSDHLICLCALPGVGRMQRQRRLRQWGSSSGHWPGPS